MRMKKKDLAIGEKGLRYLEENRLMATLSPVVTGKVFSGLARL